MRTFIALADIHLHFWKAFATGSDLQNSRFLQTLKVIRESLEKARELNCPWVCAGDWVHTIGWSHHTTVNSLVNLLNEFEDVEKLTVWGNHDARSYGGAITREETIVGVLWKGVDLTVLNCDCFQATNGLVFYGEGYQPSISNLVISNPQERSELQGLADVAVYHQTVIGSKLASGFELKEHGIPREWLLETFPLSIVGDVHHPQQITGEGENLIIVPGSPEHHNFGDVGDHGWWICSLDNYGCYTDLHPSGSPKFLTVDSPDQIRGNGDFYRVTVPVAPRQLPQNAIVVAPPPTVVESRDVIKKGATLQEVVKTWVQESPPNLLPGQSATDYVEYGLQLLTSENPVDLKDVRLVHVKILDFMCYENTEFQVQEGITLVVGKGRDFSSNGAGKTTLFEALFYALFGRTTKGVNVDELIRRGCDECAVGATLRVGDHRLVVSRARKKSTGVNTLSVEEYTPSNSEAIVWPGSPSEVTHKLSQYLGLTPDLFQALAYFSQSRLVLFSQATDSERKAMLADLCGLDAYQRASAEARSQASHAESAIEASTKLIERLEQSVEPEKQALTQAEEEVEQWEVTQRGRISSQEQLLSQLREQGTSITARRQEELSRVEEVERDATTKSEVEVHDWFQQEKDKLKVQTVTIRDEYTEKINGLPSRSVELVEEEMDSINTGLDTLSTELTAITERRQETAHAIGKIAGEISAQDTRIQQLRALGIECPTCGQEIDPVKMEDSLTELANAHQALLEQQAIVVSTAEGLYGQYQEITSRRDILLEQRLHLQAMLKQVQLRQGYIHTQNKALDQIAWKASDLEVQYKTKLKSQAELVRQKHQAEHDKVVAKYTTEVTRLQKEVQRISSTLDEIRNVVNPYHTAVARARESVNRLVTECQQEINARHQQEKVQHLAEYWETAFSRSGLQSLLLEEVAAAFNEQRTKVFPLLTGGIYDVQFSTMSTTRAGEAREKTEFIIRDRGALISYESLSGGQRRRIDLGVMITLVLAVAHTRQVPGVLGLLVLDEVFGFLDQDGVESLYATLAEVNTTIPAIYAITHNPDLQSLFERTLMVEQDLHGISRVLDVE